MTLFVIKFWGEKLKIYQLIFFISLKNVRFSNRFFFSKSTHFYSKRAIFCQKLPLFISKRNLKRSDLQILFSQKTEPDPITIILALHESFNLLITKNFKIVSLRLEHLHSPYSNDGSESRVILLLLVSTCSTYYKYLLQVLVVTTTSTYLKEKNNWRLGSIFRICRMQMLQSQAHNLEIFGN